MLPVQQQRVEWPSRVIGKSVGEKRSIGWDSRAAGAGGEEDPAAAVTFKDEQRVRRGSQSEWRSQSVEWQQ